MLATNGEFFSAAKTSTSVWSTTFATSSNRTESDQGPDRAATHQGCGRAWTKIELSPSQSEINEPYTMGRASGPKHSTIASARRLTAGS